MKMNVEETIYIANFATYAEISQQNVLRMIKKGKIRAWRARRKSGKGYVWKIPLTEVGRIQDIMRASEPKTIKMLNGIEYRNDAAGKECAYGKLNI